MHLTPTLKTRLHVLNCTTSKATSDQVPKYLPSVREDGRKRHQEFVQACVENPSRFEARIVKPKFTTFSVGNVKCTKSADNKIT